MKKILITLGFAAATIMAANAQEVPAAEEQPQTTVQSQPNVEDETLDSDTELLDDQAMDDTDDDLTEPETQTVRDEEINDMPTEPMQDEAIDEQPLLEDPTEDATYDQPDAATSSPDVMSEESVDESIDGVQEDVVEMQGEDPNAQSSMQDVPETESDNASYSSTQDADQSDLEVEPAMQPEDQSTIDQPKQDQPQDNSSAMNNDDEQGVKTISASELPEEVSQAFQDGEFAEGSIENVYLLEGAAVDKLLQNNAEQIYAGQQNPDKIYQLQVKGQDAQNILYYDENGDLLGSSSI